MESHLVLNNLWYISNLYIFAHNTRLSVFKGLKHSQSKTVYSLHCQVFEKANLDSPLLNYPIWLYYDVYELLDLEAYLLRFLFERRSQKEKYYPRNPMDQLKNLIHLIHRPIKTFYFDLK